MNVGELFFQVGIKGGDVVSQALGKLKGTLGTVASGVKGLGGVFEKSTKTAQTFASKGVKGFEDLLSGSFAVKAALVGLAYAFDRVMTGSGKIGIGITNLSGELGVSAKVLEQYSFAARSAGLRSEEHTSELQSHSDLV